MPDDVYLASACATAVGLLIGFVMGSVAAAYGAYGIYRDQSLVIRTLRGQIVALGEAPDA